MAFQAKNSQVLAAQLECQEVNTVVNAVAATSTNPSIIVVDNAVIATTVITLSVGEDIASVRSAQVHNRTTGAVVPLLAAPSTAVAQKISVTVDGTGLVDLAVCIKYKVQE